MDFTLENQDYIITLKSKGAELSSVWHKHTQTELIWQADANIWGRHAPVLFPFVGRLNQDQYRIGAAVYQHAQHGFARDSDFECVTHQPDRISFCLQANQHTLTVYPFEFSLTISYELKGSTLNVIYQVTNHQTETMPFSIGGHPGFRCPVIPHTQFQDYALAFSEPETLSRHYLEGGLFNGQTAPVLENQTQLSLNHALFEADAIVFKHPQSDAVSLVHRDKGPIVTVAFPGFEYLGLWTKPEPEATFICIEPWHGLADTTDFTSAFQDKEGIQLLAPEASFTCHYTVTIHPEALSST